MLYCLIASFSQNIWPLTSHSTIHNLKQLLIASTELWKTAWASHDWFWFHLWFVEKVVEVFLCQSRWLNTPGVTNQQTFSQVFSSVSYEKHSSTVSWWCFDLIRWWILHYLASEKNLSQATGIACWKGSLEPWLLRFLI